MSYDKRLLILGSNKLTCEIVEAAREMGLYTVVLDWNPIEKAPAKQIADCHAEISLTDVDAVVDYIKRNNIDGVITGFTDSYLECYAEICQKAGLPCYGTKELFHIFANKHIYKEKLRQFFVPCIEEYSLDDLDRIKFPVLVKPSDNSGGRGISICKDRAELLNGYEKALRFSPSRNVLIEQYIKGREVTVFYFMHNGITELCGIGNRLIGVFQDDVIGLPCGYTFPSDICPKYEKEIYPNVCRMFEALGIKNGMMFMQCLVDGDGICRVYDIGYRLTGSLEYILMEKAIGINALKELIRFAVGEEYDIDKNNRLNNQHILTRWQEYGLNVSVLAKPDTIAKEEGVEKISAFNGVVRAVRNHLVGDTISMAEKGTLAQIVLRVFAMFNDINEVLELKEFIKQNYKLTNDKGEDLLLPVFDVQDVHLLEKK